MKIIKALVTEGNKNNFFDLCDEETILNYVASDFEIKFPKGYSLQHSATLNNVFAKPYFGFHNVSSEKSFSYKEDFDYDFVFLGNAAPSNRKFILHVFEKYCNLKKLKIKTIKNNFFFYNLKDEERKAYNEKIGYENMMKNSKSLPHQTMACIYR
jgi:hypothetical protein